MFLKLLITYLLVLVFELAGFKNQVLAQESNICTFILKSSATLIAEGKPLASKLISASEVGGNPAEYEVTCTQPAKLSVSTPIQLEGSEFSPTSSIVKATNQLGESTETGKAPLNLSPGTTTILIDYTIDKGSRLLAGKYRYTVEFTATPQ